MRQSGDVRTRKVTPPSPSYMTNDQFASYLDNLRANRITRPGGARAQPPSSRPLANRSSINRYSIDTPPPSQDAASPPRQQRTLSHSPSIGVPSISSRYSAMSGRSRDYYPAKPAPPPLKPSEVVPTTTYIERGQRWMEKEEAYSLRDAMEEMDLRDNKTDAIETIDEESRIYNAALDEAAELVWQHQNGVVPRRPEGPYRYRPHLRKDSYAHARAASVVGGEEERNGRGSANGFNSPSGNSSDEDEATRWSRVSSETNLDEQGNKTKSYGNVGGNVGGRFSGGRRSSMKRNISGEVERPFSGDQIWEEPESMSSRGAKSAIPNRPLPVSLSLKSTNSPSRVQSTREEQHTPTKRLEQVEIHRNPPTRSRNAQYRVNTPQSHDPLPQGSHKSGMEIRGNDIRQATSMKLKDRSPNLPEPTAVTDSPGRPIVSFDTNWKSPEESTDISPDRPSPTKTSPSKSHQPQSQSVGIPAIVVAEDNASRSRPQANANVPSISINGEEETSAIPSINVPSIAVDESPGRRRSPPSIVLPGDAPSTSSRPLPTPGSRPGQSRDLPQPRGHWSPAPGAFGRSATLCHECSLPIDGKFVALAGAAQRFHPKCFRCYCCGISLEAMEITPEPEEARNERLDRIQRRAAGEILDEAPGMTMAEDGDERLRFYCHLDWHERFAPRCKHCKTPILEEHIVALGAHWHYGHFFCAECGDPFEHGMTHIEKDGYAWCVNCQTKRTERRAPKCKMCKTAVIGQYIKALGGEWHEHCFRCAECKGSFDDGQIFPKEVEGGSIVLCTKCRARELKY
ncbi:LIM domain-containing C4F6.12-like protein [Cladobotryum mycophilum]|uniref:LIM domain-containing C4F6.12-like protein n=1 Tax=Cladobotryum mycophilum TaxID=491253 RepID=A0ABR0S761_9HYPO